MAFFRISSYNLGRAHAKTSLSLHFKSRIKKKWEKKKKREGKILLGGAIKDFFGNFKVPLFIDINVRKGETQNYNHICTAIDRWSDCIGPDRDSCHLGILSTILQHFTHSESSS